MPNKSRNRYSGADMDLRLCAFAAWAGVAFASPVAAETIHIDMQGLGYSPAAVSAHVGDTIEWANGDFLAHTATARSKEWDVMLLPKKTGRIVLKRPGDVEYYCRFHPNMVGRITVAE
jgi:plastocyanin